MYVHMYVFNSKMTLIYDLEHSKLDNPTVINEYNYLELLIWPTYTSLVPQ